MAWTCKELYFMNTFQKISCMYNPLHVIIYITKIWLKRHGMSVSI